MGVNDPVSPQQAQDISGTDPGIAPTLPTVVTVQGSPDPAAFPVPVTGSFVIPTPLPVDIAADSFGAIPIEGGNVNPVLVTTGGGGTQDVNITEVLGAPISTGNPVPVEAIILTSPLDVQPAGGIMPVAEQNLPVPIDGGNPNPVNIAGTVTATIPNPLPVSQSGSWSVGQSGSWTVAATQSGAWSVSIIGTVPVSGTVAVSNFPATQPVSGTVTANQGTSPWVTKDPASAVTNGQVGISSTATTIVAANANRKSVTIINRQSVPVWVGIATVTTANGVRLDPGDSITIEGDDLIQGITSAAYSVVGDANVQYVESAY